MNVNTELHIQFLLDFFTVLRIRIPDPDLDHFSFRIPNNNKGAKLNLILIIFHFKFSLTEQLKKNTYDIIIKRSKSLK
jgi:hypothetical protein